MLGHRPEHRAVWGAAAACVFAVACVMLARAPGASAGAARWSAPAPLTACPVRGAPQIVFPSDSPTHATGPGALVWEDGPRCPGGERAWLAPLAGDDRPTRLTGTHAARALPLRGEVRAGAAPGGRVLVAGTATSSPSRLALIQGVAGGALAPLPPAGLEPGPLALDSSYLDDLALAGVASAGGGPARPDRAPLCRQLRAAFGERRRRRRRRADSRAGLPQRRAAGVAATGCPVRTLDSRRRSRRGPPAAGLRAERRAGRSGAQRRRPRDRGLERGDVRGRERVRGSIRSGGSLRDAPATRTLPGAGRGEPAHCVALAREVALGERHARLGWGGGGRLGRAGRIGRP